MTTTGSERLRPDWTRMPYSGNALRRKWRELGLWQRRFWEHQIRDDLDFANHVDYLHRSSVNHGYVIRVADWPYLSFHRYVARGLYPLTGAGHAEGR
jgi:putative transposase